MTEAKLKAAVLDYNDILRSLMTVVSRRGEEVNWDALEKRLDGIMARHHETWLEITRADNIVEGETP
jgi:hypothetical protein